MHFLCILWIFLELKKSPLSYRYHNQHQVFRWHCQQLHMEEQVLRAVLKRMLLKHFSDWHGWYVVLKMYISEICFRLVLWVYCVLTLSYRSRMLNAKSDGTTVLWCQKTGVLLNPWGYDGKYPWIGRDPGFMTQHRKQAASLRWEVK